MENAPSENYIPQSGDGFEEIFLFVVCADKRIDIGEGCVWKVRRIKFMAEKGKPEQQ